jgi:hypothetical protein
MRILECGSLLLPLFFFGSPPRPWKRIPLESNNSRSSPFCTILVQCKLFRMNTCKTVSKQTTSTRFRINTYEKQGEGGPHFSVPSGPPWQSNLFALCFHNLTNPFSRNSFIFTSIQIPRGVWGATASERSRSSDTRKWGAIVQS